MAIKKDDVGGPSSAKRIKYDKRPLTEKELLGELEKGLSDQSADEFDDASEDEYFPSVVDEKISSSDEVSSDGDVAFDNDVQTSLQKHQTHTTSADHDKVFKVRGVIENWLQGADNLGLLLAARDGFDNTLDLNIIHRDNNGGKHQPTLILYFEKRDKRCELEEVIQRKERLTLQPKQARPTVSQRHLRLLQMGGAPCGRHVWYVSFHQLGWNNFILSPHGFMAYRCRGQCIPVPFSAPYTNHAKLETSFGEDRQTKQQQQQYERPCCVPQRYKPLVLMFYDRYQNVVIKRYDDMIVDECGCR